VQRTSYSSRTARLIAVYGSDGSLRDWMDEKRLARLARMGLIARAVRTRRGRIVRVVMRPMPGIRNPCTAHATAFAEIFERKNAASCGAPINPIDSLSEEPHVL
jgi:hypothetical protein